MPTNTMLAERCGALIYRVHMKFCDNYSHSIVLGGFELMS